MKLYKLTTSNNTTYDDTQWGEGVTHTACGNGGVLCSDGVIHAYIHPLQAVLMSPVHGDIDNPNMWEADGDIVTSDGLKVGCKSLTTIQQIPVPKITLDQRIAFAIMISLEFYKDKDYAEWAEAWLDGTDRSARSARYARSAASSAALYARYAASSASDAARSAARSASDASDARYANAIIDFEFLLVLLAEEAMQIGSAQ